MFIQYMRFTAKEIDKHQFRYECPVCSKYVRKDGKPLVRPKRVMHAHGSNGEFHNRVEHRSSHRASLLAQLLYSSLQ